jgi:hypothetical protein
MRYDQITLDRFEVEDIGRDVARLKIDVDTPEGQELLKELVRDYRDGIWANRDYDYGYDEFECRGTMSSN